jgi:hypothetical protein
VPNAEKFVNSAARFPFEEISTEHINYFTAETLELLMKLHGLQPIDAKEIIGNALVASFGRGKKPSAHIQEYICESKTAVLPYITLIDEYVTSQKPIAVWGTGSLCQYLFANSRLSECNILVITDGNEHYQGKFLSGHCIQPPSVLTSKEFADADIFTVTYHYNDDIIKTIRQMGLNNKTIPTPKETYENQGER